MISLSFQRLFFSYKPITTLSKVLVNSQFNDVRSISKSATCFLKEIRVKTENNITVVEAVQIESDRKDHLLPEATKSIQEYCPLCPKRLTAAVKYTDVLILHQFVDADGEVLPRHITGLCYKAHNRLLRLIHQAQLAGLLKRPEGHPDNDLKWNKYNIYFEE